MLLAWTCRDPKCGRGAGAREQDVGLRQSITASRPVLLPSAVACFRRTFSQPRERTGLRVLLPYSCAPVGRSSTTAHCGIVRSASSLKLQLRLPPRPPQGRRPGSWIVFGVPQNPEDRQLSRAHPFVTSCGVGEVIRGPRLMAGSIAAIAADPRHAYRDA